MPFFRFELMLTPQIIVCDSEASSEAEASEILADSVKPKSLLRGQLVSLAKLEFTTVSVKRLAGVTECKICRRVFEVGDRQLAFCPFDRVPLDESTKSLFNELAGAEKFSYHSGRPA